VQQCVGRAATALGDRRQTDATIGHPGEPNRAQGRHAAFDAIDAAMVAANATRSPRETETLPSEKGAPSTVRRVPITAS